MTTRRSTILGLMLALAAMTAGSAVAGEVRLADKGKANCVIVVPQDAMVWAGSTNALKYRNLYGEEPERRRRLLRDSVADLALYLGKMAGTKVEIVEGLPAQEKRIPIYIGSEAQRVFGPVGKSMAGLFGFRVVAGKKGVGLYGESEYGTSYAIYELLHRLGCRWYMPSEMGECIPSHPALGVPETDESLAPATEWRSMQGRTADGDFRRRNRMGGGNDGGNTLMSAHALEAYITKEQRAAHPEWCLLVDGKPHSNYLRWTRQDVADAIADAIIQQLDKTYMSSVSLSPGDYVVPTEDPEEMKSDPVPRVWEPAAKQWSVTDRLILLANRVADRVGKKYPDVRFGLLAYVNYSMPPAKQKVHPNVIPVIAPIDFNRHHPMTWTNHPNDAWLLNMVEGWGKASPRIGYYAYGMNLAELSAPCPFITKWGTDIPIILSNHCAFWMPETMNGWESMMPGFYLSTRLSFNPSEKPEAILNEMWTRFYGAAAAPMGRYWTGMDRAWIDGKEYAGSGFGYLRIFTPEVMKAARADMDEALSKCRTIAEYKRVKLVDESLTLFELFMKMRRDWAAGRLAYLAYNMDDWRGSVRYLRARYKEQFVLGGLTLDYVNDQYGHAYDEASRVARELTPLAPAMLKWKFCHDKEKSAEALGWTKPEYDDAAWKTTHVVEETWSTIGHHNTMGWMAYRTKAQLAAVPAGKKAFLWIGSTDASAKLFVNGQHVKYVVPEKTYWNAKGDVIDASRGYCQPSMFDITAFLKPGANQITILCERNWLNEVGTGGLMGPVVAFREK
ncbi:MAG: DUF4838 domain-containing protein [Kiritimatiellia bacterium]